jgi:dUTP pyrophosphatase
MLNVLVKVEEGCEDLPLPKYQTDKAAGMDLHANVPEGGIDILPGRAEKFSVGCAFKIPNGFEGQIRPRSSVGMKCLVYLPNSPGTVDADYTGIVHVTLHNQGPIGFHINRGDRICQMVISPVMQGTLVLVDELPETRRGSNGFGSTGSGKHTTNRMVMDCTAKRVEI